MNSTNVDLSEFASGHVCKNHWILEDFIPSLQKSNPSKKFKKHTTGDWRRKTLLSGEHDGPWDLHC